jgi:hypothetical protein
MLESPPQEEKVTALQEAETLLTLVHNFCTKTTQDVVAVERSGVLRVEASNVQIQRPVSPESSKVQRINGMDTYLTQQEQ